MDATQATPIVIGVDTGGTFTDVFVSNGVVVKVASTPANPVHAILDGLRNVGAKPGALVAHGTTVATNAVLERTGAKTALITTAGFEDVLEIRRQNRPALYDLRARWPAPLVPAERRIGIAERLDYEGNVLLPFAPPANELVDGLARDGVEAIAVCLLFSYVNGAHEQALSRLLRDRLGQDFPVSLSSELAPLVGEFERTSTTVVNAYVMPVMRRYLTSLIEEAELLGVGRPHVMHSNGGLLDAETAAKRPVQTILSGPAAGVVGARAVALRAGYDQLITFDMGGTSTDVSVVPGEMLASGRSEISSFPLLLPTLLIETVGAGGGSIARVDAAGGLRVGPDSAGADPGPAAYGSGTEATVTDANLVLGRLAPSGLLGGAMPLDPERASAVVATIARQLDLTVEQAAWAIVRLANSNMERTVRAITLGRGYDPRRFVLFAFGGAGPLHAAELAGNLDIGKVLVPAHPGVMAALGLTVPDLRRDFSLTVSQRVKGSLAAVEASFQELERSAQEAGDDAFFSAAVLERSLDVRYVGQSFDLRVPFHEQPAALAEAFHRAHRERYGRASDDMPIEIVNLHVQSTRARRNAPELVPSWPEPARPPAIRPIWFGETIGLQGLGALESTVWWRPSLPAGTSLYGPALLEQYDSATLIPPGWEARVDSEFNLILRERAS